MIEKEFPKLVKITQIGLTHLGQPMRIIQLTNNETMQQFHSQQSIYSGNRSSNRSVFFSGAHHARELTSIQMNYYLILKILFNFQKGDNITLELLNNNYLFFLPVINIDGFMKISEHYQQTQQLSYIRKNRNKDYMTTGLYCQSDEFIGVDLNRNYGYQFGISSSGSSSDPCAEDYRGPSAFSEPETQAVRDFATSNKESLVLAFNFHAYGNLFIHPFNYDDVMNENLYNKFYQQSLIFSEIHNETGLPEGSVKGNGQQTIEYDANGEASDWFLGELEIPSLSPELGIQDKRSQFFFIHDSTVLKNVLVQNQYWVLNSLKKLQSQISIKLLNATFQPYNTLEVQDDDIDYRKEKESLIVTEIDVQMRIKNKGFELFISGTSRSEVIIEINTEFIKKIKSIYFEDSSSKFKIKTEPQVLSLTTFKFLIPSISSREHLDVFIKLDSPVDFQGSTKNIIKDQRELFSLSYLEFETDELQQSQKVQLKDLHSFYTEQTEIEQTKFKTVAKFLIIFFLVFGLSCFTVWVFFMLAKKIQKIMNRGQHIAYQMNNTSVLDEETQVETNRGGSYSYQQPGKSRPQEIEMT